MSDVTPKRTERKSGSGKIPPDEPMPSAAAATIVPEVATAAQVVSAPPGAVAEPAPEVASGSAKPLADSAADPWTLFAEAQAALARGFEEIAVEVTGMTRSGIAAAMDAAVALLEARSFSEAVEIHTGLARRRIDAITEGSARMSEIGVAALSEASRPILSRLGGTRSGTASA